MAPSSKTPVPAEAHPSHEAPHGSGSIHPGDQGSQVQVSAVLSTYLLTHLHQVLQRAEFGAQREGQTTLAANYAQLRKLLCHEARSMGPVADGNNEQACLSGAA